MYIMSIIMILIIRIVAMHFQIFEKHKTELMLDIVMHTNNSHTPYVRNIVVIYDAMCLYVMANVQYIHCSSANRTTSIDKLFFVQHFLFNLSLPIFIFTYIGK